jgi:hypothetical protein
MDMNMENWGSALLFGSLFIAVLALALYVLIPSIREGEKKVVAFRNRPLDVRYAKEIASGEVVIREFDQQKSRRRLLFMVLAAGLFVVVHKQFQIYINHMGETCAQLWGWNYFFVNMTYYSFIGIFVAGILMFICIKDYREALKDGYFPPRKSHDFSKIKISNRITKKIKLIMQFQVMICGVLSVLVLSIPVNITLILIKVPNQNSSALSGLNGYFQSLSELNSLLQKVCVHDLKQKMKEKQK